MPSISDTLEQLSSYSNQIHQYSQCNRRPSGPYTTAYLYSSTVPDLIRDGTDPERRLFKFIGETGDSVKKVEKKEGPVTPLKELGAGRARGGKEEIEVVLRTAARLVDDYRPMPRARNHITALAEQHEKQSQKIAELERVIAHLSNPATRLDQAPSSPTASKSPSAPKSTMSVDEAIAAEEASLRRFEAYLKPHRETVQNPPSPGPQASPEKQSPQKAYDESPIRSRPSIFAQTPGKTPSREYPHIANSLVAGGDLSPHRSTMKINRFTPLKNISTPQRRERGSIFGVRAPRSVGGLGASTRRPFAAQLASVAMSPTKPTSAGLEEEAEEGVMEAPLEDETIRLPSSMVLGEEVDVPSSPVRDVRDVQSEVDLEDQPTPRASPVKMASPAKQASPAKGPKTVQGIVVDDAAVVNAIACLRSTYPDLIDNTSSDDSVDHAIQHLQTLSTSNPEPVPSSDQSSASSTAMPSTPITKEVVSLAILCLIVLRSPELVVPMGEVKETFAGIVRERGWDDLDGGKMAWKLIGKRCMRIDRSGAYGAGGALRFV